MISNENTKNNSNDQIAKEQEDLSKFQKFERDYVYKWNKRLVTSKYSDSALLISNILGPRLIYIIAIILAIYSIFLNDFDTSIRYYGVLLLGVIVFMPIKFGIARRRPFLKDSRIEKIDPKTQKTSFPSGHSFWVTLILLFQYVNFELPWWSAVVLLIISVGLSLLRISFGAHYPTDLAMGHFLAIVCLWFYFTVLNPYWIWLIRTVLFFIP